MEGGSAIDEGDDDGRGAKGFVRFGRALLREIRSGIWAGRGRVMAVTCKNNPCKNNP